MEMIVITTVIVMIVGTIGYALLVNDRDTVRIAQARNRLNCFRSPLEDAEF